VRQLTQVVVRPFRVLQRLGHQLADVRIAVLQRAKRELLHDHRVDEALLRAVVQVALDPAPALIGGSDDSCARGGQLGAALGIRDRSGDELCEVRQARLGVWRQRPLEGRAGGHDSP
jgi:hypothetical protein